MTYSLSADPRTKNKEHTFRDFVVFQVDRRKSGKRSMTFDF